MELDFDNRLGATYDSLEERYKAIMATAFSELKVRQNYEVDVSLVDDETIHQINRDYRHVDRITDVISFAFNDDKAPADQIHDLAVPKMLGEIFIDVPQALRQAQEIGNTPMRELRFLFTHGLLHLLGYDHMKPEDEAIMFPLQEQILGKEENQWKKKNSSN
jgi:probable rRNA maturation factor